MKFIVWTRINQFVFGEAKTNTFENEQQQQQQQQQQTTTIFY